MHVLKWGVLAVLGLLGLPGFADTEQDKPAIQLQVIDAYADVHSGPGRSYPVFYVIEQGESIELLTRRPDWYEVKIRGGRTGWVKAAQIARTLQPTGEPVDLPSVSYGDYLKNSWRVGFSVGPYNSGRLDKADVFSINAGYRPLSWLGVDIELGKFYATDSQGDLSLLNLVIEPFSQWKVSPVLLLGTGETELDFQAKGIAIPNEKASFTSLGAGAHYYLGRSFVVRLEYRELSVDFDDGKENLGSWKLGFNTFF